MGITGALLYMVLLGVGATITPGDGVAGSLLTLVPQPLTEYSHVPAYGLLAWLLTSSLRKRGWPQWIALGVGAFAAMVFGLWMEILQAFVPGRVVDSGDVAFNSIGIGLAALLVAAMPDGRLCVLANRFSYSRAKRQARRPWHLV
jgi:VanZ family protein